MCGDVARLARRSPRRKMCATQKLGPIPQRHANESCNVALAGDPDLRWGDVRRLDMGLAAGEFWSKERGNNGEYAMRIIDHHIVGLSGGGAARRGDGFDPNTGQVQASVNLGTQATLDAAVAAALKAQPGWAATNPQRRARVMFTFKALVEAHMDELAHLLSSEHGKVI
eukprot:gene31981-36716_t